MLQLQSIHEPPGTIFATTQSVLVLEASTDWDSNAVRAALLAAVESLWTTSRLGLNWVARSEGPATYYELDGLTHLVTAANGRFLAVANASSPLLAVVRRMSGPTQSVGGEYAAGFQDALERQGYAKMLRLIETPFAERLMGEQAQPHREPLFFSDNLASLVDALKRVESTAVLIRDTGPLVSETVTYRLGQ